MSRKAALGLLAASALLAAGPAFAQETPSLKDAIALPETIAVSEAGDDGSVAPTAMFDLDIPAPATDGGSGAAPPAAPTTATVPSLSDRPTLTNDWFGNGPAMRQAGVTLRLEWSQFYQGLVQGQGDKTWLYGGHLDALVRFDLSKMGFWSGLSLTAQGVYNYGKSVNGTDGTVFAANSALFFPNVQNTDGLDIVDLHITQTIGKLVTIDIGKINLVESIRYRPIAGGGGVDMFWNLNPALTSNGITAASLGAARISVKTQPVSFSLMIYDPIDSLNEPLFSHLFKNGAAALGSAIYKTAILGRTGFYTVSGGYTTKAGTDFRDIFDLVTPGDNALGPILSKLRGSWTVGLSFQQYIFQDPNNPNKGWGIFGSITRTDSNPTIFQINYLFGISGSSPIQSRPDDRFGVSLSRFALSNTLRRAVAPVLSLRDEYAVEVFYDFAVTPWLRVKPDAQLINPAQSRFPLGAFAGLQTYVKF